MAQLTFAELSQSPVGQVEVSGHLYHRLGPDQFVELVTREGELRHRRLWPL